MLKASTRTVNQAPVKVVTLELPVSDAQVLRNLLGEVGGNGTPGVEAVHRIRTALQTQAGLKYKGQFKTKNRYGTRQVLKENA